MTEPTSPLFTIFALLYVVLLVYTATNFIRDTGKLRLEGKTKKEASTIVRKDYRNGLINPKHKMFPCGVYLLALFVYWVLAWGILR